MIIQPTPPTSIEKRRAPRRRVLKGAIVAYNDACSTTSCIVRDMSSSGARLHVASSIGTPDEFLLMVELDGIKADCKVVWRTQSELGVAFTAPPREVTARHLQVTPAVERKPSLRRKPNPAKV